MANITELLETAERHLRDADALSNVNSDDLITLTALNEAATDILRAVARQERRMLLTAQLLEEMADSIGGLFAQKLRAIIRVLDDKDDVSEAQ